MDYREKRGIKVSRRHCTYIETDPFRKSVFPIIALMIYGFPLLDEFFA